jgi:hypothetical protein
MFRHYIAMFRERFCCLLRDAQLRSSRSNIVDGRVVPSNVVRGDSHPPRPKKQRVIKKLDKHPATI